jgi:hypothetical protein
MTDDPTIDEVFYLLNLLLVMLLDNAERTEADVQRTIVDSCILMRTIVKPEVTDEQVLDMVSTHIRGAIRKTQH